MRQQRTIHIFTLLAILVLGVGQVWGFVEETVTYKDVLGNDSVVTYNVVYLNLGSGDNSKDGASVANAVKDWKTAYSKLPKYTGTTDVDRDAAWDHNIIVVCGQSGTLNITDANTGNRPVTITGVWPWVDNEGNSTITGTAIQGGGRLQLSSSARGSRIGADTKFKNICFGNASNGTAQNRLCLYLHNTYFDTGCVMINMSTLETSMGATDLTTHKAPKFHLMLFSDEHDFTASGNEWNQTKPMTLTIKSGRFGRILCTRIAGTAWDTQTSKRYVVGTPDKPLMAKIVVDIDESNDATGYNPTGYKDDIAFLCAGTTQGVVFADIQMDIRRGKIATVVAGSQGNAIKACEENGLPSSAYYGRTIVNVDGKQDKDVIIYRYFGACLGRLTDNGAAGFCKAYFYGHSELNLHHGTIEQNLFASAGGLSGLKNPNTGANYADQHTIDSYIPYQGGSNNDYPYLGIDYNSYDAKKTIVKVISKLNGETETIDLAETKIITNIQGGLIKGNVYGGSFGYSSEMSVGAAPEGAGSLWGNTEINISGGTIGIKDSKGKVTGGNVYGGGAGAKSYYNLADASKRDNYLAVATVYGNTNLTITGKPTIYGNIYGGGAGLASQAQNAKDTINVNGTITYLSDCKANEFLDIAKVYGNTNVTINADEDWTFTGNIYGGGAMGAVTGNTNVQILGGNITGNVYAASAGEAGHADKGKIVGNPSATISGGNISENVFGGGELAPVTGNPVITVNGGTVTNDVYGGGALADVTGSTTVNLTGGTIGNSYGGGLGSRIGINGATADVAALVHGDATTTLNGSKVNGNIFGANNINGTPLGHVKVHVLQTVSRGQEHRNETGDESNFDVKAVYGGGNQAAYVPTGSYDVAGCLEDKTKFAEVLIENCDNSIAYVYGGGNAAPVPATQVTIYGANAIDNAFAGGNGLGDDNDGADIGYLGFYSLTKEETPKYGCGETDIKIYGGTVNNVFGGSNTLGYIRTRAYTRVLDRPQDYEGAECDLNVGEVYGAGNKAEMYCPSTMELACSQGADVVYGGAKQVDYYGDATLTIVSGTYGQVFGGNNMSGNVRGSITINVDETGCYPVKIGELYGGGNLAAYSVYGYDNEGHCITRESDMPDPTKKYADPTINLISFTEIGKVFGGGLGESAVVYGNPTVNINPIKGKFAGEDDIPDAVGTIGTIYGGGNEAAVYGNTTVNIATEATNNHLNAEPGAEAETVDAIITGNVYGGGSQADVHGNTNVTIGPSNTL